MKTSVLSDHTIYIDAMKQALMNEKKLSRKRINKIDEFHQFDTSDECICYRCQEKIN